MAWSLARVEVVVRISGLSDRQRPFASKLRDASLHLPDDEGEVGPQLLERTHLAGWHAPLPRELLVEAHGEARGHRRPDTRC